MDWKHALVALSDGDFNPLQPLAPLVKGVNLVDSVPRFLKPIVPAINLLHSEVEDSVIVDSNLQLAIFGDFQQPSSFGGVSAKPFLQLEFRSIIFEKEVASPIPLCCLPPLSSTRTALDWVLNKVKELQDCVKISCVGLKEQFKALLCYN